MTPDGAMEMAHRLKYKAYDSVYQRYPGIPAGVQLLDAIKRDFLVVGVLKKQPHIEYQVRSRFPKTPGRDAWKRGALQQT